MICNFFRHRRRRRQRCCCRICCPKKSVIAAFQRVWKLMKLETIFDEFTERKLHVIVINIIMHTHSTFLFSFCRCCRWFYFLIWSEERKRIIICILGNDGFNGFGVCAYPVPRLMLLMLFTCASTAGLAICVSGIPCAKSILDFHQVDVKPGQTYMKTTTHYFFVSVRSLFIHVVLICFHLRLFVFRPYEKVFCAAIAMNLQMTNTMLVISIVYLRYATNSTSSSQPAS